MVRYVIDASVACKWFFFEDDSDRAFNLLKDFQLGHAALSAPDLLIPEIGNTLWKRTVLRSESTLPSARRFYARLLDLGIDLAPSAELALDAFAIAEGTKHQLYDCLYVALAKKLGCQLITADERLARKMHPAATVRLLNSI